MMKISKEFILREIAGEYILVPVGKTALTFNGLVTVNEVGALIWGMLEKGSDVSTIVNGILDEYDVDEHFIQELEDHTYLMKGLTELSEVEDVLKIEFDDDFDDDDDGDVYVKSSDK